MDKQQIAHILEKEIGKTDKIISGLQLILATTIDYHQARDLHKEICDLITHKQKMEEMVEHIVEDAKVFNPPFNM